MSNEIGIDRSLLTAFLQAVEQRHIGNCEALLQQVGQEADRSLNAHHWYAYLSAILTDIRDNDWASAERQYQRVLQVAQIPQFLRGQVLLSLGISYLRQGRWLEAEDAYKEALQIYTETREAAEQAKTQNNLAVLYWSGFSQGDFDARALRKAEVLCNSSLITLAELAKTPEILSLYAMVWNTLGMTCMSLGRIERAVFSYEQMLDCNSELGNHFGMGVAYANLGETYHRQGPLLFDEALTQYEKALQIFRADAHLNEALDILANLAALYAERQEFTRSLECYAAAIDLSEKVRAGQTSEVARAGYFSTINDLFSNAVLTCFQLGMTTQAFNYAEQARARAFLDLLDAGLAEMERSIGVSPLTLEEVQQALPENALLLEYYTTGLVEAEREVGGEPMRHRFPPARTLIFAITRTGVQIVDAAISPNDLYPKDRHATLSHDLLTPHMRRVLYDKLVAPFADLLQRKQYLYLIPHGPLHYVPFQALLGPREQTLLSEEGPQLVYAPSATVLLRNAVARLQSARPEQKEQPAFPCLSVGHNGGAVQLRFAEDEAQCVAALVQGHHLTGDAATKANLLARASQYAMLHLSCHGTFDAASPLDSALHLSHDEKLTAREVLEKLHLRSRLVTLSACESGLSQVRRGDELFGLVRAFLFAGAEALIVTQWRVDERSTHILMERLYSNIRQNMSIPQALKEAQLYLRSLTKDEAGAVLQRLSKESNKPKAGQGRLLDAQQNLVAKGEHLFFQKSSRTPLSDAEQTPERVFEEPYHWAPFVLIGGIQPDNATGA